MIEPFSHPSGTEGIRMCADTPAHTLAGNAETKYERPTPVLPVNG